MAAAIEVQKGDKLQDCWICKRQIGVGQWEVRDGTGHSYHHPCFSHGSPQPIEVPERFT